MRDSTSYKYIYIHRMATKVGEADVRCDFCHESIINNDFCYEAHQNEPQWLRKDNKITYPYDIICLKCANSSYPYYGVLHSKDTSLLEKAILYQITSKRIKIFNGTNCHHREEWGREHLVWETIKEVPLWVLLFNKNLSEGFLVSILLKFSNNSLIKNLTEDVLRSRYVR